MSSAIAPSMTKSLTPTLTCLNQCLNGGENVKKLFFDDITNFKQMLGDAKFEKLAKYDSEDRPFNPYYGIDLSNNDEVKAKNTDSTSDTDWWIKDLVYF